MTEFQRPCCLNNMTIYPEEIQEFIFSNYKQAGYVRMTRMVNERFGTEYTENQIHGFMHKYGLKSEVDTKFKKGNVPKNPFKKGQCHPNSVATQFKKGSSPKTKLPIGTISKKHGGYYIIKVADPDVWKLLHIYIWEQANGPLPENHCVIFLDGDRSNCKLENLMLVTRGEHAIMNRFNLRGSTPELNTAGVLTARTIHTIREMQKEKKNDT